MTKTLRNTLLLVLAALIWGVAFVAQSVGAEHLDTFTFLAVRSWLAGFALLAVAQVSGRLRKRHAQAEPSDRRMLLIGGAACGCILFAASAAQQAGIAQTTTAKAGFLTTLYVVLVPIASMFLGKRVGRKIWLCVALGLAGLYLLCMRGRLVPSRGDALVLLCALLFTGHILLIDRFSPHVNGIELSCAQFFVVALLSTVCAFLFETPRPSDFLSAIVPILYAGLLSSAVAYTLQIVGQKGLNPTIASLAMCLESVFSALAGWAILGQTLTGRELTGCALMFAAIVLAQLPDRRART